MGIKSPDPDILSVHTYWDSEQKMECPLCDSKLEHAFNDGGRNCITIKGKLWVVTNYYRCLNSSCKLHQAFPMVHNNVIMNKKFGKDVWERVIRYHFKTHLDYGQIKEILWDDSGISIAKSTIKSICKSFETAGVAYQDHKIKQEIKANGQMIIALDGAQPKKGSPALWIFTEQLTKRSIKAELLVSASAPVLVSCFKNLEKKFGVPITAVISDKQKNIVNAVKRFNPEVPHVYCQYHFLNHIMGPIQAKDSHIATQIRKHIRMLSIITNLTLGYLNIDNSDFNQLYLDFAPLAEELLNAISVSGKKWEIMPGKEIYENLSFIIEEIKPIFNTDLSDKHKRTLNAVYSQLINIIKQFKSMYNDISNLLDDSADLRKVLGNNRRKSKSIQKEVKTWVYRLQSRLKRRNEEYFPQKLKYKLLNYQSMLVEIWQQWVRLEWSYHDGIYLAYDDPALDKTNNNLEQLINKTKRHFKKWLGQQDIQATFERNSENYVRIMDLDYSSEQTNEILWGQSVAFTPRSNAPLEAFQPVIRRNWKIRMINSGNLSRLMKNLNIEEKTIL